MYLCRNLSMRGSESEEYISDEKSGLTLPNTSSGKRPSVMALRSRRSRICLICFVVLIPALTGLHNDCSAQQFQLPALDEVVERVKRVYAGQCCFSASFDQVTVNVAMDLKDRFRGIMHVKKPSFIALEVQWPERQQVIIKGTTYTVYFPEDGNSTNGEIPPEMNIEQFFGFFAAIGEMDRNFSISFPAKSFSVPEQLIFVELADKKRPSGTYRILLGIDFNNYTIRRAVIHDALGNYNRFDLSGITFSDSLPDSKFTVRSDSPGGLKPFLR